MPPKHEAVMEPLDDAGDHVHGGSAGPLIVEHGDYECPYSRVAVEQRDVEFERGRIGCRDSSPRRHASADARGMGHPIARSAEPGENWSRCYVDNVAFVVTRP